MSDTSKWHKRYLGLAKEVSTWSKDPSRCIGAVAVSEKGRVLATGYNGFPRGINDSEVLYQDREYKYSRVVHAEMNCIYNATYNGVCLDGSTMYIWGLPMCSDCAKGAIQVGVRAVYFDTEEEIPDQWLKSMETTIEMFGEVGVEFRRLHIE